MYRMSEWINLHCFTDIQFLNCHMSQLPWLLNYNHYKAFYSFFTSKGCPGYQGWEQAQLSGFWIGLPEQN